MSKKNLIRSLVLYILPLLVISCAKEPQFKVEGTVLGATDSVLYLEHRGLTLTTVVDSVKIEGDGSFKLEGKAPQFPDLYALRMGNRYINLGVDSTETIVVKTSYQKFATDYTVEGSINSNLIKEIALKNGEVTSLITTLNKQIQSNEIADTTFRSTALAAIADFKQVAINIIVKHPQSIAAYFAVFQKVEGGLLFDPYDKKDSRMYGAVATQWDANHKESERAKHLHSFTLMGMKTQRMQESQSKLLDNIPVADEVSLLEVSLPGIDGKVMSLKSFVGKPIILDFTSYKTEYSPAHNSNLNKVYEKYAGGVIIYQISFDPDAHVWKNAAVNLPWVCVRDEQGIQSELLVKYNVQALPTTYLIDKNGNLIKRLLVEDNILSEVGKVL